MIHVRLAGGLGNQLFQLAAASLVHPSGNEPLVAYTGALGVYAKTRQPDALRLVGNVTEEPLSSAPARAWAWFVVTARAGRWLPGIGVNDRHRASSGHRSARATAIVDGYFQRGWTDKTLATAIGRMNLRAPNEAARQRVCSDECVVHVRGGDFLRIPAYRVTGLAYYARALGMASDAGIKRFAVMSDDPAHARQIGDGLLRLVPDVSLRLMEPTNDVLSDFDAVRCAAARVIGNSTFAWWAAALSNGTAPTWSPGELLRGEQRDYFLPTEIPIDTRSLTFP